MIGRIFFGGTMFLAGVGTGTILFARTVDKHGEELVEAIEALRMAALDVFNAIDTEEEPSTNGDGVVDGTATEEAEGHPSDTAAQPAPEAPEQS